MNTKSDAQIHREVLEELRWDTWVRETEVGVQVEDGVVILAGVVESYAKKAAAAEAAHRVAGVLDVVNDLEVRIPDGLAPSDAEIAKAVRHAIDWDTLVSETAVQTTVSHGWVTLEGTVPFLQDKLDLERALRYLKGVRGLTNRVVIAGMEAHPDQVRVAIERALERRADREARRIRVRVSGHTVALEGSVHTSAEKRAILGAAGHAPGVSEIEDRIRVEP